MKKILQKSIIVLVTAFMAILSFGGTGVSQKAYADEPAKTGTATTTEALTNEQAKELCTKANGTYEEYNNTCFIAGAKDCTALPGYEILGTPATEGVACQKSIASSTVNTEQEKVLKDKIYVLIPIQRALNTMLWPVLVMIGDLMNNNILFGAGMDERLREIWIPVRNLINLFFVLAMVVIAIYNILGVGDDNDAYSIKQVLPKIIIAIIAVNFSFTGIKIFLDGINVLTSSIFALPDQVKEGLANISQDPPTVKRFCLATMGQTIADLNPLSASDAKLDLATYKIEAIKVIGQETPGLKAATSKEEVDKLIPEDKKDKFKSAVTEAEDNRACKNNGELTERGKAFLSRYNTQNAALAMALNMSKIVFYPEIDITTFTSANISKLFINTIFSMVMYVIFVASFFILFVILVARLVVLWLGIVASPVIIVAMVLPVFKEKLGLADLLGKFVKNAVAPILIAFAMTVGWIMLRAIQNVESLDATITLGNGIPVSGLNTIQDLIVAVGTVGVLWFAVKAASAGTIAEPVTGAIMGALGSSAKWIGDLAWKHTPIFPVPIPGQPGLKASAGMIGQTLKDMQDEFEKIPDGEFKGERKQDLLSLATGLKKRGQGNFEDLKDAGSATAAINRLTSSVRDIERGGENVSKGFQDFNNQPFGKKLIPALNSGTLGREEGKELGGLIEKSGNMTLSPEDRDKAQKDLVKFLENQSKMGRIRTAAEDWDKRYGLTPATPAPEYTPNVSATDKLGSQQLGAQAEQIKTATKDLVTALQNKSTSKGDVEQILTRFTANGQNVKADQLLRFIKDPIAVTQLKKILSPIAGGTASDQQIQAALNRVLATPATPATAAPAAAPAPAAPAAPTAPTAPATTTTPPPTT